MGQRCERSICVRYRVDGNKPDPGWNTHTHYVAEGTDRSLPSMRSVGALYQTYLVLGTEYKGYIGMILVTLHARDLESDLSSWRAPACSGNPRRGEARYNCSYGNCT